MIKNHIAGSIDNIGFVAIESEFNGKWVLCFHKNRGKWEVPGGHVDEGETPLVAAKRELYEETGAIEYDIVPVWDYELFNDDGTLHNNGRVYFAKIHKFEELPKITEMEKIEFFDKLPINVTYDRDQMISMLNQAKKYATAYFE